MAHALMDKQATDMKRKHKVRVKTQSAKDCSQMPGPLQPICIATLGFNQPINCSQIDSKITPNYLTLLTLPWFLKRKFEDNVI